MLCLGFNGVLQEVTGMENDMASGVLIVVENLPVPFDRRVWMEATTLRRAGYQVSVICPKGKGFEQEKEVIDGIHIYRHPLPDEESSAFGYVREYAAAIRWEFRLAQRVWEERGFDIIHICNPPDLLFLVAAWFKWRYGTKVVFDHHDLAPELYRAKFGRRGAFYWALRATEWLTYRTADVVIATNESHKRIALTRGGKKRSEIFIVQSGPDLSRFVTLPEQAYRYRKRQYVVGYVGVMGEQEGVDTLLKAAHHLVHGMGRRDVHFMLIGGGPVLRQLIDLASELDISEYVEFAGWCFGQELIDRLGACDVCVSPDPKTEYTDCCTMNKVLEYMALGKPIVQFDLVEARRSAGDAALYARPGDHVDFARKIHELLSDPERAGKMGAIGRERIEDVFEWRHQVPHLLAAYRRALEIGGKLLRGGKRPATAVDSDVDKGVPAMGQ